MVNGLRRREAIFLNSLYPILPWQPETDKKEEVTEVAVSQYWIINNLKKKQDRICP